MPYWWQQPVQPLDESARAAARLRQDNLTKPPGSLGRMEQIAIELAAMQSREKPRIERPWIAIFAGDHGVVAEGVSAFPQAVTQQMLANFVNGGAAIAVLARAAGARLEVIDAGTLAPAPLPGVLWAKAGDGSANFTQCPAMSEAQLAHCLASGRASVERALAEESDLFIGGEMGIGNTTAAAALSCALLGLPGRELAGPGTGLDSGGVNHKAAVIDRGLALHGFHSSHFGEGSEALRCLGGFEIAALAGAYLACAQRGLPALVDGFITTAAALAACRMNPGVRDWLLFAHASAEPGHVRLLAALEAEPLLRLEMRLGEGSGAAMALPLLRLACELHGGMATFAEAGVSNGVGHG
ncbi:MAG: nicotinate-nucleotide--dimethylbenzimidazole phosphoribosyltransferase [Hydrogenophilales bacterium CG17_big_fil_post_rev_8_21_14_2_50_63_12]|nr:MAG: nicotinate-nucleotide--dimethylbenzimidazole phosphoribosyltransferase [Hydrogenophilales bacterium CG17_big_fil_post_rev_8_21_14_2_50_63_12]PIX96083.1 MAG: nicotinate-nucleotide--dimethylbenzimidazole phosphoribosyltransferase [Hydrogenophilales bacterium CG_4_10_14_3_um_filter_63_21]